MFDVRATSFGYDFDGAIWQIADMAGNRGMSGREPSCGVAEADALDGSVEDDAGAIHRIKQGHSPCGMRNIHGECGKSRENEAEKGVVLVLTEGWLGINVSRET